jgi:hypothetical protein
MPPCAELAKTGTGRPSAAGGLPSARAAASRRARGTYGVYVVCGVVLGCCGGGGSGPVRRGGGSGSESVGAVIGGAAGVDETAAASRAENESAGDAKD